MPADPASRSSAPSDERCTTCGFGKNRGPNFCSNPFHLEGEWRNGVQVQSPALPVPAQEAEALVDGVVAWALACHCIGGTHVPYCQLPQRRADLLARLRSPSEIPEARRVRDLVQFHRSESCEGERCTMCGKPAAMKVGEEIAHDDPFPNRHNFTAYVCLECGNRILCPYVFASRSPEETPDAAPQHRCGVRGFDSWKGDVCPACTPSDSSRSNTEK